MKSRFCYTKRDNIVSCPLSPGSQKLCEYNEMYDIKPYSMKIAIETDSFE